VDAATKYGLILLAALVLLALAASIYGLRVALDTRRLSRDGLRVALDTRRLSHGTLRAARQLRAGQRKHAVYARRTLTCVGFAHLSLERFLARVRSGPA
jgi:hypothetical protein